MPWTVRFLVALLNLLGLVAPRIAGHWALVLFRTPRRRRATPTPLLDVMVASEMEPMDFAGSEVMTYRWRAVAGRSRRGRILLVHGWESCAGRLANWVEPLRAAGFDVVALDAPAHGASGGRRLDPFVYAEAVRALAAREGGFDGAVGHSMGGYTALLAALGPEFLGGHGKTSRTSIQRFVLLGSADSAVTATHDFCAFLGLGRRVRNAMLAISGRRLGRTVDHFDGRELVAGKPLRGLWFHAPEDADVSFSCARRTASSHPGIELIPTPGLGHHLVARDLDVIRRGVELFEAAGDAPVSDRPGSVRLGSVPPGAISGFDLAIVGYGPSKGSGKISLSR